MRVLTRVSSRFWNRLLAGMVILLLLVLVAGLAYENARFDAFIQGKINIDRAEIASNGLTLAQAEQDFARDLGTDRANIAALQQKVAALQAQDAQLEAQIAALQAALGEQAQSPSPSGNGGTAAPTSSPRPSSTPTVHPTPTPCLLAIICLGSPHAAAQCSHAHHHC